MYNIKFYNRRPQLTNESILWPTNAILYPHLKEHNHCMTKPILTPWASFSRGDLSSQSGSTSSTHHIWKKNKIIILFLINMQQGATKQLKESWKKEIL